MVTTDQEDRRRSGALSRTSSLGGGSSAGTSSRGGGGERTALVPEDPSSKAGPSHSPTHREQLIGYAMVFLHALCMTASSASVQALRNKVPHFELVLLRFLTLTLVASLFLVFTRQSPRILGGRRLQAFLVAAALINTTTFTLYYASSYFIALGPIGGLYRATTLIVSMVLAKLILKEGLNGLKMVALGVSVVGMVLIVFPAIITAEVGAVREVEQAAANQTVIATPIGIQAPPPLDDLLGLNASLPVMDYYMPVGASGQGTSYDTNYGNDSILHSRGDNNTSNNTNTTMSDSSSTNPNQVFWHPVPPRLKMLGYLLILIAGVFNSAELIMLSGFLREVNSSVQAFWFGVFGTLISALIMLITETPTLPSDPNSSLLFTLHAIGAAMSIFTFIFALKYLPASNAAIAQSIHIALMYIAQWTFMKRWNEDFDSLLNLSELLGTLFILTGVLSLPINDICKLQLNRLCGNEV